MPFGGYFDKYYESIFQPAIKNAKLEPKRADDLYRPSTIVNDIWAYTKKAKLVLADLTGKNANVFYELGLAHALAKPVILVAESMEDVPFDLRALRVLEYSKHQPNWGDLLKEKITTAIAEVIAAPLEAVLPAFLDVKDKEKQEPISTQEKALLELRQDMDLLRHEMRRTTRQRDDIEDPRILGPEDAEAAIKDYLIKGVPDERIIERLTNRGVPSSWAREKLPAIKRRMMRPAPVVRRSTAPAASARRKNKQKKPDRTK
jgi:hypothetical protein